MISTNPFGLAAVLILIGGIFFLIAILTRRVLAGAKVAAQEPLVFQGEALLPSHQHVVLMVEPGGRIRSMNTCGRVLFHLQEGEPPNLERLTRMMRPVDALMRLCAQEGRARLVLEGKQIEAVSYRLPDGAMLVSLVPVETASGAAGPLSPQVLQTFGQTAQAMAGSLDLRATIHAILSAYEKVIAVDYLAVGLWDAENQRLVMYALPGHQGSAPDGNAANPVQEAGLQVAGEGLSGLVLRQRQAVWISDLEAHPDLRGAMENIPVPLRSFLGLPLAIGTEFLGAIELGSEAVEAFKEEERELLSLLAGPASIALRNAFVYHKEQQRTVELTGLARLAQAFGSARDPDGLFSRLVDSIAPLVDVEILGFLLYNETHRVLEARAPFHGLPGPIVALYRAEIAPGSQAENLLLNQDVLITENALEDATWSALGMGYLAQAASLRETVLVPLATAGRMLGYLQASNHTQGSAPFSPAELHLLTIIANQAASIIENAALVQQSRQRAQRAEALRRITSLASASASIDEVFGFSLRELGRLLRVDVAAVLLLDPERGLLALHESSLYRAAVSGADARPARGQRVNASDAQYPFTVTSSQRAVLYGSIAQEDGKLVPFYKEFFHTWGIQSAIAVPLVAHNEGIGELWMGSASENFFEPGDQQVIVTAAGALAAAAEQANLRGLTDESLRRRLEQMTAITRISRELSTSLDLNDLLNMVYDEALRITRADCGTILLFEEEIDRSGRPKVRFFVGDMPEPSLTLLEQHVVERNTAERVGNLSHAGFEPPHVGIRSALVVPISSQQRAAGLICLHGRSFDQFDETALEISQSLAVQAAVALNNALAYEEQTRRGALLKRELETLSRFLQVTRTLKPGQPLRAALYTIAQAIQYATPFQAVALSVCDPDGQALTREVGVGISPENWAELQSRKQPWRGIQKLMQPQYRVGAAYYIPYNKKPVIPTEVHIVSILPRTEAPLLDAWHQDDLLLVPLTDSESRPLGMISVDAPADHRRPDRPTFEALEVFAAQASSLLENARRTSLLEQERDALAQARDQAQQAAEQAQGSLPAMLHKELQQAMDLRSLSQRIERIRASLEIASQANRQESERDVLHVLASELLERFSMRAVLVAEGTEAGPRLIEVVGGCPAGANLEALFGQRNPLRQMLQAAPQHDGAATTHPAVEAGCLLVSDLDSLEEWRGCTLLNALEARSLIGMTLDMGQGRAAGVLALGERVLPAFSEEDRRVFAQLAYQVSVGLRNVQLLNETRMRLQEVNLMLDFSRKLGSLSQEEILDVLVQSVAQVLPSAHSAWVGIWEDKTLAIVPQAATGYASREQVLAIRYGLQNSAGEVSDSRVVLPLRVFRTGRPERVDEVDFAVQYSLGAQDLLRYRKATAGRLPVSVMCIPLRVGENVLGIMFFENFDTPAAFHEEDEALVSSFTRQAAMALENARLFQASERRASQLQALTAVAETITSSLKRDALVSSLLDQLRNVLAYDTATLWLREDSKLTVSAAAGFSDNDLRAGLSVAVEDSALFLAMIQTGEPLLVGDLRNDARFPSLLEPEYLSWLGIPLMVKSEVIGVIALEKREADFYTPDTVQAATAFASQAAVALENARLYEESMGRAAALDERSQRLGLLNRLSGALVAAVEMDEIIQITGRHLLDALDANGVAALLIDPVAGRYVLQPETTLAAVFPPGAEQFPRAIPASPLLDHLRESRGIFQTDQAETEGVLAGLREVFLQARSARSLLLAPLAAGVGVQGWFLVYRCEPYRYAPAEIALARTMCNQAAIAIQNARLFAETRSLTEDLERRVEARTRELRREHTNSRTMLQVITELSASLEMNLVLNRTLGVLNDSVGCEESVILLTEGATMYRAGISLACTGAPDGLEHQVARWVVQARMPALVERIQQDDRWTMLPGQAPAYQSLLAVPLVMGQEVLGALLLLHRDAGFFDESAQHLMEAAARQIGIALNNAELFNLIRDQSEHLGAMLREQQIESSRSRAILEAVADGVLVTDARSRVTLFNASAERILSLCSDQVLGQSLDHFSGLFGKAAQEWMKAIHGVSRDPERLEEVGTYVEQVALDNGRIVAVHLAPVFWRQEFLGTVSIFRDITHEVQVDRLKSEFVANVSHELRTPMTSIKGYVEILLMGAAGPLSDQQGHFLKIVQSNTERLSVLVNDLIDLSRIETGRVSLNIQTLDMREMAAEVILDVQRRARDENKEIHFELTALPGLPFAKGDPERIRQVLSSLISNGYTYTPAGGCVAVRLFEASGAIQVDVQDSGIGIAPEARSRIFERFYRGEDPLVLASAGTGLGLAIARTMVEMHQGRIWFESSGQRGAGSTFSFTLPTQEEQN
jgi:PAS domain S-box-containing protein